MSTPDDEAMERWRRELERLDIERKRIELHIEVMNARTQWNIAREKGNPTEAESARALFSEAEAKLEHFNREHPPDSEPPAVEP